MTVPCGQKLFQEGSANGDHRGPHGQFHRAQPVPARQRRRRQRGQPGYLGGELRLDLVVEPLFSPSGSGGAAGAAAPTGRASQIASFTSTISSVILANWWYCASSARTLSTSARSNCRPRVLRPTVVPVHTYPGP